MHPRHNYVGTVKALKDLLEAPTASGGGKKARRGKSDA